MLLYLQLTQGYGKKRQKITPMAYGDDEDELLPVKTHCYGSGSLGLIKVREDVRGLMRDAKLGSGGTA